jgi:hypothetical protein
MSLPLLSESAWSQSAPDDVGDDDQKSAVVGDVELDVCPGV